MPDAAADTMPGTGSDMASGAGSGSIGPNGAGSPARPLRVLELGVNWFQSGSGGLDRVFYDLMQALPGAGVDATGLVLGPADVAARSQGRVQGFGRPDAASPGLALPGMALAERLWRARAQAGALAKTGRFDLVASHFALFTLPTLGPTLGPMRGPLRRLPLVVHFHGPWADESAEEGAGALSVAAKRAMERAVYRRAARVIVLSQAFGAIARDRYGVAPDRIRQVPGSVDLARFDLGISREEARARLGWPRDRRILLSVRRLARRMGLDRLLDAMAQVVRAQPDALLMIAGRGHMAASLQAQAEALGLSQHVRFLGFLPDADLPLAYRAAEINIIPTVALEGFGLTTVEALASGTPSMVSPAGALPEVVSDLSPDLIFRAPAADDMADRIKQALSGALVLPGEQACRDYVRARYGAELAAQAVANVYREVV